MSVDVMEKPQIADKTEIGKELQFTDPSKISAQNANPELTITADGIIERMLSVDVKDIRKQGEESKAIRSFGLPIQQEIAKQSKMLSGPMTQLVNDAEDGGRIGKDLLSLQECTDKINPNRVNFEMSGVRRLFAMLPFVGTPLARWFSKYQSIGSVIKDVMKSLEDGRGQLQRDNDTLCDDQLRMRELTFKLENYIQLGHILDVKMTAKIEALSSDDKRRRFFEEEILFPLRQRIIDLQQQLAVNQQGVIATEVIIRNNRELITTVNRTINVTGTALQTAATLQVALQRQKKVLEASQAVMDTTNDLIAGTAKQLKEQGVQIQKQAAGATLDIEVLKTAFADVDAAMQDISEFRRNALPQMAQSILEMDSLTKNMDESITKMEAGNAVSEDFAIEIVDSQ